MTLAVSEFSNEICLLFPVFIVIGHTFHNYSYLFIIISPYYRRNIERRLDNLLIRLKTDSNMIQVQKVIWQKYK